MPLMDSLRCKKPEPQLGKLARWLRQWLGEVEVEGEGEGRGRGRSLRSLPVAWLAALALPGDTLLAGALRPGRPRYVVGTHN